MTSSLPDGGADDAMEPGIESEHISADREAEDIAAGPREKALARMLVEDLRTCKVSMLLHGIRSEASRIIDPELLAVCSLIFKSVDSMKVGVATAGQLRRAVRSHPSFALLCDTTSVLGWLESTGIDAIKASRELRGGWRQQVSELACDLACRWRKRMEVVGAHAQDDADILADHLEALDQYGSGGVSWDDAAARLGARAGGVIVDALQETRFAKAWRAVPTDTSAILSHVNSSRLAPQEAHSFSSNDVSVSAWFPDSDAIVWEAFLAAVALSAPTWEQRKAGLHARALAVLSVVAITRPQLELDESVVRAQLRACLLHLCTKSGGLSEQGQRSYATALAARASTLLSKLSDLPAYFASRAAESA